MQLERICQLVVSLATLLPSLIGKLWFFVKSGLMRELYATRDRHTTRKNNAQKKRVLSARQNRRTRSAELKAMRF
uniref:Uncharacterized protein n=1 Tax=Caenorhabditis japonica TaxID=281687 RepID=A0A8R1ELQ6_CAEJA